MAKQYDVYVLRTETYGRTIRVEADSREEALSAAADELANLDTEDMDHIACYDEDVQEEDVTEVQ